MAWHPLTIFTTMPGSRPHFRQHASLGGKKSLRSCSRSKCSSLEIPAGASRAQDAPRTAHSCALCARPTFHAFGLSTCLRIWGCWVFSFSFFFPFKQKQKPASSFIRHISSVTQELSVFQVSRSGKIGLHRWRKQWQFVLNTKQLIFFWQLSRVSVEGKDTTLWRDQALDLGYCQNSAVGGRDFFFNYLSHQFGNRLKTSALLTVFYSSVFCECSSLFWQPPLAGLTVPRG